MEAYWSDDWKLINIVWVPLAYKVTSDPLSLQSYIRCHFKSLICLNVSNWHSFACKTSNTPNKFGSLLCLKYKSLDTFNSLFLVWGSIQEIDLKCWNLYTMTFSLCLSLNLDKTYTLAIIFCINFLHIRNHKKNYCMKSESFICSV